MSEMIKVGAAKVCIDPAPELFPFSLSFSDDKYTGVKEGQSIHARAIAVNNGERTILFLGFDLVDIPHPERLLKMLKDSYGLEEQDVHTSATHNHSSVKPYGGSLGPGPMGEPAENEKIYTEFVFAQIDACVGKALNSMRPARYAYGEDKSYINVNRDQHFDDGYWMQGQNFEGCSDKTVAVVKFTDEEGKVIAGIVNYACHSVTNFTARDVDGGCKISCDFPGIASSWLEDHFGNGAVVMWQQGAAGNQNPILAYANHRFDRNGTMYADMSMGVDGATYPTCVVIGEQHAVDCLRAFNKADTGKTRGEIGTAVTYVQLPGQKFPEGINRGKHRLMVDNIVRGLDGWEPGMPLHKELAEMIPTGEFEPMKMRLTVIGDIAFVGLQCELYNEIGCLLKEKSPFRKTIITTFNDGCIGYILDDDSKDRKVFQSFGRVHPGRSNGIITKGMLDMFDKVIQNEQ